MGIFCSLRSSSKIEKLTVVEVRNHEHSHPFPHAPTPSLVQRARNSMQMRPCELSLCQRSRGMYGLIVVPANECCVQLESFIEKIANCNLPARRSVSVRTKPQSDVPAYVVRCPKSSPAPLTLPSGLFPRHRARPQPRS